jgi:hypothetical protein
MADNIMYWESHVDALYQQTVGIENCLRWCLRLEVMRRRETYMNVILLG